MATVNTLPTTSNSAATDNSNSSSAPTSTAQDSLANESTFLTLLVTQLKNQNPMNPMDGTAFVTQLAQFSNLEQNLAMRQDLDALANKYAPSTDSSSSTSTHSSSTPTSSNSDGSNAASGTSTGTTPSAKAAANS